MFHSHTLGSIMFTLPAQEPKHSTERQAWVSKVGNITCGTASQDVHK
jgi:hypothetical protein